MPDIALRFNKDMLVLSAPIDRTLTLQGVNVDQDREFFNLIEPESVHEAIRLEALAGAQCMVTNTAGITEARLAHAGLEDRAGEIASAALRITNSLKPQHVLAEIGPALLPLDPSSKTSLMQSRNQYAQATKTLGEKGLDAYFLNGMVSLTDMMCALMGIRAVSDMPIFASMKVDGAGTIEGRAQNVEEAAALMSEYEADVVGIETAAPIEEVIALVDRVKRVSDLPILMQLEVVRYDPHQAQATAENPYYSADTMIDAATMLRQAGVQFMRATGDATPAYTGALVAVTSDLDVIAGG